MVWEMRLLNLLECYVRSQLLFYIADCVELLPTIKSTLRSHQRNCTVRALVILSWKTYPLSNR